MLFLIFVTKGANVINLKTKAKNLRSQVSRIFEGSKRRPGSRWKVHLMWGKVLTACFEGKGAAQARCVCSAKLSKVLELCTL